MRLEVDQIVRHRPPHAHRLVGFADVSHDDMLEDRLDGLGHVSVGDGGEVVMHRGSIPLLVWSSKPHVYWGRRRFVRWELEVDSRGTQNTTWLRKYPRQESNL